MTKSRIPTVGVFDSGIGGLSIVQALVERLGGVRYVYGCDTLGFPYGIKSDEEVVQLAQDFNENLLKVFPNIDILVIACNTASTIALEALRTRFSLPIVGVVPALKPAVQMSRTATIGLLATPATVARPYTKKLIEEFARGRRVLLHGSSRLVEVAEAKLRGGLTGDAFDIIAKELHPLFEQSARESYKKLDTIVLGCTHFPHLRNELEKAAPWPVQWVDSGQAIAARVATLLMEQGYDLEDLRQRPRQPLSWLQSAKKHSTVSPYLRQWILELFPELTEVDGSIL